MVKVSSNDFDTVELLSLGSEEFIQLTETELKQLAIQIDSDFEILLYLQENILKKVGKTL